MLILTKYVLFMTELLIIAGVHGHGHALFLDLFLQCINPRLIALERRGDVFLDGDVGEEINFSLFN